MKRNLFVLLLAVAATVTFAPLALADCGKCGHGAEAKKADCPMHAKAESGCAMRKATAKYENVPNGVQVTLTSDDPETVKSLQDCAAKGGDMHGACASGCGKGCAHHAEKKAEGCCGKQAAKGEAGGCSMKAMKDAKRETQNLPNGVQMTWTSDKPEVVKGLQEHAGKCPVLNPKAEEKNT